ncbi:uncharacterized protein LOC131313452 [Rhododendron vialii]|uniref:uncharacterized protein LOC131313452 n=1 Tax=Rhododendron vialii TaxID=182163 RepID=UPI00265D828B|nr:uncharacterized protein LOC131313452 [Rhododendron vialii]XP_058197746.1 uncharacterized protein LOC131313452 [Rhododendron vialii]XP_058197747.1 uncharacterized protein LOC131313452 [Rhododendron vialii]
MVHVMISEKGLAKSMSNSSSTSQRLLLQDAQGNKMQNMIYGDNIEILANTLKLYHTYAITNAIVMRIKEQLRFLNKLHQLVISAKSPVEEIKINGFSQKSLQFNFTPLSDIHAVQRTDVKIDALFAVMNVGPHRKTKSSYVVDLRVIDARFNVEITNESGLIPATIFAEKAEQLYNITAPEMVNNTTDGNMSVEIIQKLSTPIKWAIMLRASMYTYGTISQCVFSVHSIFNTISEQQALEEVSSWNLEPKAPKKRGTRTICTTKSPINDATMEEDGAAEPSKNKQKKE